jgi:aldehyde dehydrogenase (NAD+)
MERLAAELETRAQEIGRLVSAQNGMPIALSPIIEGMTPVGTLRYMVSLQASAPVEEETSRFLGGDLIIRHEPVGVVAVDRPTEAGERSRGIGHGMRG